MKRLYLLPQTKMTNDEALTDKITKLLLEYDAGYTPPEIPKWLALIHAEKEKAYEEGREVGFNDAQA